MKHSGSPLLPIRSSRLPAALALSALLLAAGHAGATDAPAAPLPETAPEPPAATSPADECRTQFRPGQPELFDFVQTRAHVNYPDLQGRPIRRIDFLTLPVFNENDPGENNKTYRFINRMHIKTRNETVRKQILVREGDPVDDDLIRESERILRDADFLYDAMILPGEVCPDGVTLLVVVRDIWTLQPNASFKRIGGENSSAIGISDNNILGYGHSLSLSFASNSDRRGVIASYENKHLIDGHTRLRFDHGDNNDGKFNTVIFERPFYALDTRWSAGIAIDEFEQQETVEANGIVTNEYDHDAEYFEAFFGLSAGLRNDIARRVRLGLTHHTDTYFDQDPFFIDPLPADRILVYPWVEYESVENRFLTTSNLEQMFRNEDLQVGSTWRLRVGYADDDQTESTVNAWIGQLNYTHTPGAGLRNLTQGRATVNAVWNRDTGEAENTLIGYRLDYYHFIDERNRWYVTLRLDGGINLDTGRELTAGGNSDLRGYPSDWQRGDRRAVLSIERRHYYNLHLFNLFRIGTAAYIDAGRAWDSDDDIVQSEHVLSDIGIGLRINPSKASSNHVIHLNLAFPNADREEAGDSQWSVYAEQRF
ncbi:MAG: hypothetical protein ACOY33_11910 [Pseudomonadota bacterium]